MWLVRLIPSEEATLVGATESIHSIQSDDVEDFFKSADGSWSWGAVEKMLKVGTLARVEVDYIPTTLGGQLAAV